MRATSHCANHPSHEALHRCSTCGIWVCERCVRDHHDRAFCSRRCQLRHDVRKGLGRLRSLLSTPISPAWAIGLTTAASVLVAAGVGRLIGDLMALSEPPDIPVVEVAVPVGPQQAEGRLVTDEGRWRLEIAGEPGARILVEVAGVPVATVLLDDRGRAEATFPAYPVDQASVTLAVLGSPPMEIGSLPTATATPPPTPPPSATPATVAAPPEPPSASPTASAAATPSTPDPSPTPTATATALIPARQEPTRRVRPPEQSEADRVSSGSPPVLHLVADAGPRLALTFDGAASSNGTIDLLNVLRSLDLTVTVFVTGEFIERNPGIVRRAALAGHEFGNHTFSHPHLTTYASNRRHELRPEVTRELLHAELRRTEESFRQATGRAMAPLWRAPYGEENRQLRAWAMEIGYLHVRWSSLEGASLDSLDWVEDEHSRLFVDSRRMAQRLLEFPRLEGGIVLMHLSTNRREPPWTALPDFVRAVQDRGLAVGSVTDLLRASTDWWPWYERAAARHREVFETAPAR